MCDGKSEAALGGAGEGNSIKHPLQGRTNDDDDDASSTAATADAEPAHAPKAPPQGGNL